MLEINKLSFSYPGHKVFSDLSFQLEGGNVYGLLGENGVGKTTLLKILSGMLKNTQNTCRVNGFNPYLRQPAFLQDVYYLPEDPACLPFSADKFASTNGVFYPNFDKAHFFALMDKFGVDPMAKMTSLSMGQQKKAHISYALSLNTRFLLMDEPSNGMDIPSKSLFRSIVSQHVNQDRVIVISTHQVRDLENLIDPVIILDRQGIILNATIDQIAEKLYFFQDLDEDPSSLYSEETPAGYFMVKANVNHKVSKVNLEGLFNAAMQHKQWFKDNFNK